MGTINLSLTGSQIDEALVKARYPYTGGYGSALSSADRDKIPTAYSAWTALNNITTDNFSAGTIVTSSDTIQTNQADDKIPTTLAVHNHIKGFVSSHQAIPDDDGSVILEHGLGVTPSYVNAYFEVINDINLPSEFIVGEFREVSKKDVVYATSTKIYYRRLTAAYQFYNYDFNPDDSGPVGVSNNSLGVSWRLVLKATI